MNFFIIRPWGEICKVLFSDIQENLFLRKNKKFFNIRATKFHSQKYKEFFFDMVKRVGEGRGGCALGGKGIFWNWAGRCGVLFSEIQENIRAF